MTSRIDSQAMVIPKVHGVVERDVLVRGEDGAIGLHDKTRRRKCLVSAGDQRRMSEKYVAAMGVGVIEDKCSSGYAQAGPDSGNDAVDLPPLKWSSLKYDFRMEDEIDGEEEAYG